MTCGEMKTSNMTRPRGQVYCVGNYLMTGKVLGKGHFARVEEATHRIIGKKVAIKIIDLTCIKEEYARRNLHREPRVMAKLRHPCIAALYETMMHGPRLYVVMEAAGGGDLCAHVLCARGAARGLPEARARHLAAQLVSAVKHMHARGVVHRDLKMENIMLDTTKQFIKIVDFGLSNIWTAGGALRTPCGSLEYAAPELFVDGRRYGPEVDLWSIGVIVYGMVTGGLPFTGVESGEGRSRPQLRAAIARGFTRKQRAALACVSNECKMFVQQLLEPNVESRMKIDEAARHRWIKKPGMKMKTHPLMSLEPKAVKEIHRQISELCGHTPIDVMAQIRADPFGAIAGMYNIKIHLHQMHAVLGTDLLWSSALQEPRPLSPPEYKAKYDLQRLHTAPSSSKYTPPPSCTKNETPKPLTTKHQLYNGTQREATPNGAKPNGSTRSLVFNVPKCCSMPGTSMSRDSTHGSAKPQTTQPITNGRIQTHLNTNGRLLSQPRVAEQPQLTYEPRMTQSLQSPRLSLTKRSYLKKPTYRAYDNGDCGLDPRLPSIDEHSSTDIAEAKRNIRYRSIRAPSMRKTCLDDESIRLNSCPTKISDGKRSDFYGRAGDGLPCWRSNSVLTTTPPTKILLQNNATTIKRASLGNIVSPHSSSNSHCKSERAMPVGWYSSRGREAAPLQRFRRTAPMK